MESVIAFHFLLKKGGFMEKIIYHTIENDVKNIGKDEKYPTQFIVNNGLLKKVSDPTPDKDGIYLVQGTHMYILMGYGGKLSAYADGFYYNGVHVNSGYTENAFDHYDLGDGNIGFYIIGIDDNRIKEGVIIGKGMQTYKRGKVTKVTKNEYVYDGDSELCAVVVKRSDGKELLETFYSLGSWFGKNPYYEDEVIDKYQKKDSFIKKLIK